MQYLQGYKTFHKLIVFGKVAEKTTKMTKRFCCNRSKEPSLAKHEIRDETTRVTYSAFCPNCCVNCCFLLHCGATGL